MVSKDSFKVIFIIGAPGSGKNTLCDSLKENFNLKHFGAGDLLREEIKKKTEEGIEIEKIINEGKIVPVKITVNLIRKKMEELGRENIFLIDGYPRNEDNINGWNSVFDGESNTAKILGMINLDCSEETCFKRLLSRSETSGRSDDNKEVMKKRFDTFKRESAIVVDLMKKSVDIFTVDAEKSPKEVYESTVEYMTKITK